MKTIKIEKNLVPYSRYPIKCPYEMKPIGITIHNTANSSPAKNEIIYMARRDDEVSFHFAVDENGAVQGLPLDRNGWHASDGGVGTGNRKTIAIEIARSTNEDESLFDKAEENASILCAMLCKEYGWNPQKDIYTHMYFAPNKKYCPHKTLDRGWQRFLDMVEAVMKEDEKPAPEPQPQPQPATKTLYRVQVGAYAQKENAEKMLKQVKEAGFNGFIVKVEVDA